MEKHQYGFAIMNWNTGRDRCYSFWGTGTTEEECKKDACRQADAKASQLSEEAYQKAREKAERKANGSRMYGLPSRESYRFGVVGCLLWK